MCEEDNNQVQEGEDIISLRRGGPAPKSRARPRLDPWLEIRITTQGATRFFHNTEFSLALTTYNDPGVYVVISRCQYFTFFATEFSLL